MQSCALRTVHAASRAYRHAIATLTTMTARPPVTTFDPALATGNGNSKSIFTSFLPNFQGQGPIGSTIRIILKIHHYTFRRITSSAQDGLGLGSKKKDEEMRGKAVKVVDLLEHSAELGNSDALFTLAQISLVNDLHALITLYFNNYPYPVSPHPTFLS